MSCLFCCPKVRIVSIGRIGNKSSNNISGLSHRLSCCQSHYYTCHFTKCLQIAHIITTPATIITTPKNNGTIATNIGTYRPYTTIVTPTKTRPPPITNPITPKIFSVILPILDLLLKRADPTIEHMSKGYRYID